MKKVKMSIVMMLACVCIVACANEKQDTLEDEKVIYQDDEKNDRIYTQKSKEEINADFLMIDVVERYKMGENIIVDATYMGGKTTNTLEIDDELEPGKTLSVGFMYSDFSLNEVIRNNGEAEVEKEFRLYTNEGYGIAMPDLVEGDRVIMAIAKPTEGTPNEECYLWNDVSMFIIKSDGTIFSGMVEDDHYTGYKKEDFIKLITE